MGCDGDTIYLNECKAGEQISIVSVFYGRISADFCPRDESFNNMNCTNHLAETPIENRCNGQNICMITVLTDPPLADVDSCPETPKYIAIMYSCHVPHIMARKDRLHQTQSKEI